MKKTIYALPYGIKLHAEIERDEETDTARVTIDAPLYMNKRNKLSFTWMASQFSDRDILNDKYFVTRMIDSYGGGGCHCECHRKA